MNKNENFLWKIRLLHSYLLNHLEYFPDIIRNTFNSYHWAVNPTSNLYFSICFFILDNSSFTSMLVNLDLKYITRITETTISNESTPYSNKPITYSNKVNLSHF